MDLTPKSTPAVNGTGSVLVTGAAGFVGARLVEVLAADGYEVVATDVVENQQAAALAALDRVRFVRADLLDRDHLDELVSGQTFVVHLAAVRMHLTHGTPRLAHEINVGATFDLMAASAAHAVERFIYGSSHTVYGAFADSTKALFTEDETGTTGRGLGMYAATKLAAEAYLEAMSPQWGFDYLSLRFGTIYGPRLSDKSNASLLTDMLVAIDEGRRPQIPWTKRSLHALIYVDDVVAAIVRSLSCDRANLAVNVVGEPITSERIYSRLSELYGADPASIEWLDQRERFQLVDRSRLASVLGLTEQTPLDEGLTRLIDWHHSGA